MEDNTITRAEQMRLHIGACQSGILPVKDYCKQHGLAPSNYYYWLKKLQKAATASFVQIMPSTQIQPGSVFATIRFPNGVIIELSAAVNTSMLKELACCT